MTDPPPIYIPSKSRAATALTPRSLDRLGRTYTIIVEDSQHDGYAARFGEDRLLVLDPQFQNDYETLDSFGFSKSLGPGPARNMAWAHAMEHGHAWHWVMDDNIEYFYRFHRNNKLAMVDDHGLRAMEEFGRRYRNAAMLGPQYEMFVPKRSKLKPFVTGTRIYSCNLIRCAVPYRWRGRYNEDTILSLDLLKAGWQTVQFNAFLQNKIWTQTMSGGNTTEFYAGEGTSPKSQMLADTHPDVARVVWRFGRVHHHVDYSRWLGGALVPDPDYDPVDMSRPEKIVPVQH